MLDITYQNNSICGKKRPITNPTVLQIGDPLYVNTIEVDDLLGDKLTAFAPNTIGVRYTSKNQFGRPKSTEIIKQMYDCAYLANHFMSLDRVAFIYKELGAFQIKYEKDNVNDLLSCLKDTIRTCELFLSSGYRDKNNYKLLMDGVRNFNDYKIDGSISIIDIQFFSLSIDIIASKIVKKIYPSFKAESKLDYLVRTGIKEKELALIADKAQIDEFLNNCLISLK